MRATLTFSLPDSYSLRLEVDPGEHRLHLVHPDLVEPMLLGTMDCHQMSDLFRWEEFLTVTGSLARHSVPASAHELLLSFYVAVTEDCADQHLGLLRSCLVATKVFRGEEVEYIITYIRRVAVRRDFRWVFRRTSGGWLRAWRRIPCGARRTASASGGFAIS